MWIAWITEMVSEDFWTDTLALLDNGTVPKLLPRSALTYKKQVQTCKQNGFVRAACVGYSGPAKQISNSKYRMIITESCVKIVSLRM